jgi:hypothetical protein
VYDSCVVLGFFQLYFDLYMSELPEIHAAEEIHRMMDDQREKIGKYDVESL